MKTKNKHFKLLRYFKEHKLALFFYFFALILSNVGSVIVTLLIAKFISIVPSLEFVKLVNYLLLITGALIASHLCEMLYCNLLYLIFPKIALKIKQDLINKSFEISSKCYNTTSSGFFISRITDDSETFLDAFDNLVDNIGSILGFLITFVYIVTINIYIGLMILITMIILAVYEFVKSKLYLKNKKKLRTANDRTKSLVNEIVKSEKDIKSLDLSEQLKNYSNQNFSTYKKHYLKTHLVQTNLWNIRNIIIAVLSSLILYVGLVLLKNSYITVAALLFIFMNRDTFYNMSWHFGDITRNIADIKVASDRINEFFDENLYPTDNFGQEELENCIGEITFKNVTFSYVEKENNGTMGEYHQEEINFKYNKKEVFKNLTFTIPANKTVAFVGKSGSGKTTILSLISKLFEVDSGEIFIDDKNINLLSKDALRNNISLVNQFPYIFNASIKQNLLLVKNTATDTEIMEVCKKARLESFINELPNGINTVVGEDGIKLSGGQKQRLAIARALLKNSKIILFDESTSSLDNITQNEVKESIDNMSGNHTIVVVAHRLSTIKNNDLIYFLNEGVVEDSGTFKYLINTNENFKNLFRADEI